MGQEVCRMLRRMDSSAVETQLALHCAPLLTGLKASNLFILQNGRKADIQQTLNNIKVSCYLLTCTEHRSVFLLYRFRLLACYLLENPVREMLYQLGYREFALKKLLSAFAQRYRTYMENGGAFPHEMGLFLGYPVEDVRGFIENNGKNFLYAGYWKVYQDMPEKVGLFRRFDLAKEKLLRMIAYGASISDAVNHFNLQERSVFCPDRVLECR